jgi:hypothetical protein
MKPPKQRMARGGAPIVNTVSFEQALHAVAKKQRKKLAGRKRREEQQQREQQGLVKRRPPRQVSTGVPRLPVLSIQHED